MTRFQIRAKLQNTVSKESITGFQIRTRLKKKSKSALRKTVYIGASASGIVLLTLAGVSNAQAAVVNTAPVNIVQNGGFETGDFTNWTQSGNTGFTNVTSGIANSGNYSANFGPIGSLGYITQTLATQSGQVYNLSYFLRSDGFTPNRFQAIVGGNILTDIVNLAAQAFTQYDLNFTATSSSTDLAFGLQNNPGFLQLDDVSVEAVPEPLTILGTLAAGGMGVAMRRKAKKQEKDAVKA